MREHFSLTQGNGEGVGVIVLLMQNEGTLGIGDGGGALEGAKALLVEGAIAADDGVGAIGDGDLGGLLAGIENDNDVSPRLVLAFTDSARRNGEAEGDGASRGVEEGEVLAHEVGRAETEGGMMLAQGNEVLVILKDLGILGFVGPVKMVDLVGRLEAVVNALLRA